VSVLPAPQPTGLRESNLAAGLLGLALIALVLLAFRDTAAEMVAIWLRSATFTHAFLVPPIVGWLVWRRRAELAAVPRRAQPWLLLPIATVCAVWLLAELASVNAAAQFAFVTLLVLCVPALFGWAVARLLAFALLFAYFAVPFGDFMVEPMMDWTADFTVMALQASGVPVYREGLQFVIPSGHWSVVEACSGVRYLIASFMVGTLYAYLNYRSWQRRLAFVAISLAVPIVANWLRAYMIVMLAHHSSNKIAVGADHLLYGWVFFGIVIFLMFTIGARFSQAPAVRPVPASAGTLSTPWAPQLGTLAGVLLLALGTQHLAARFETPELRPAPPLRAPLPAAGWQAATSAAPGWTPHYREPNASVAGLYAPAAAGPVVGLWIGYYRDQTRERKLVSSTNGFLDPESKRWAQVARGRMELPVAQVRVPTATLRASIDVASLDAPRLHAAKLWWIGGRWTSREAEAKLRLAFNRLLGRGDDAAVLVLYTPVAGDSDSENAAAERRIAQFAQAHWPAIEARLAGARGAARPLPSDAPSTTSP
jgi:exosortase A